LVNENPAFQNSELAERSGAKRPEAAPAARCIFRAKPDDSAVARAPAIGCRSNPCTGRVAGIGKVIEAGSRDLATPAIR
jgi:hypothetical protein